MPDVGRNPWPSGDREEVDDMPEPESESDSKPEPKPKPVTCFEVGAYLIERGQGEHSLRQLYVAKNEVEAVRSAIAWGREREKALGWFLGCIKVWHYVIHPPEESGIRS